MESHIRDLIIVGGGLRGTMLALAISAGRPDIDFILIERESKLGGGPIDPYFIDQLSVDGQRLLDGAVVAEWGEFFLSSASTTRRVRRRCAMISPDQLHAEVLARIDPHRIRTGCGATAIADGVVMTWRGAVGARNVINFTDRTPLKGRRLWCQSADFALPDRQRFAIPFLADSRFQVTPDQGVAQYLPLSAEAMTVRAITIAERLGSNGPSLSNLPGMNNRTSSHPLSASSTGFPQRPADPLLPSHVYDAVALVDAILTWRLGDRLDLEQCWGDLRKRWKATHMQGSALLDALGRTAGGEAWCSLVTKDLAEEQAA